MNTYGQLITNTRVMNPLIHHITNQVTINDCANITLDIGASPIMADDLQEVAEIVNLAQGLVLNMGTLNHDSIAAMNKAGETANKVNIPIVLDPVGVGASTLRNQTVASFLNNFQISVLRGNISEIRFIAGYQATSKGVDASKADLATQDGVEVAQQLAKKLHCIVAITGATDIISDGNQTYLVKNGDPRLATITGTGCMCSSLVGSLCGGNPQELLLATTVAIASMGIAGEIASQTSQGSGGFHAALHDVISLMDQETFQQRGRIHVLD